MQTSTVPLPNLRSIHPPIVLFISVYPPIYSSIHPFIYPIDNSSTHPSTHPSSTSKSLQRQLQREARAGRPHSISPAAIIMPQCTASLTKPSPYPPPSSVAMHAQHDHQVALSGLADSITQSRVGLVMVEHNTDHRSGTLLNLSYRQLWLRQ